MKTALILSLLTTSLLFAQSHEGSMDHSHMQGSDHEMHHASDQLMWHTDYDKAAQMAAQTRKPMILYFTGSDWCGWCKKMDQEVFSSPAFAEAVGHKFIFVKLDFPMNSKLPEAQARQNAQLKQRYGVTGYPTVVIVDSQGGFIGETGYRSGGGKAYAMWLEQFLSR